MARLEAVTLGGTLTYARADPASGQAAHGPDRHQERWPGPVTLVIRAGEDRAGNMGANWHEVAELPFEVAFADDTEEMLRRLAPDVTLLPVNIAHLHMPAGRRVVITAENPALTGVLRALGVPVRAAARARGTLRRAAVRYRSVVRRAVGVQCNVGTRPGTPSHAGPLELAAVLRTPAWRPGMWPPLREARRPVGSGLRLGFSGRLSEEKAGPQYAVEVARLLRAEGLDATLTVYGSGPWSAPPPQTRTTASGSSGHSRSAAVGRAGAP